MRRSFSYTTPTVLLRRLASSPASDTPPRVHPEVEAWAIRAASSNGFGGELIDTRNGGGRTYAVAHVTSSVELSDPLASAVVRARRYVRRAAALFRLIRRWSRQRAQLRQLQSLDDGTLRDLGLNRSEIDSVHAESTGRAAATRRAFVEHEWFRYRAGVPTGIAF